jgi:phosphotransferase system HPr (HPr) family protein
MLVKTAQEYDAEIAITYRGYSVNAKSIMGVLTLAAGQGAEVAVTAQGCDADRAVRAIEDLFACCFHEEGATAGQTLRGVKESIAGVGRPRCGVAYATATAAAPH